MYRRRKRRTGRLVLILGAVVVLSVTWIMWPSAKNTQADPNEDAAASTQPELTSTADTRQARDTNPAILTPTAPVTSTPEPQPVLPVTTPKTQPDPAPGTSANTTLATAPATTTPTTTPEPAPGTTSEPTISVPIPEGLKPAGVTGGSSSRLMGAVAMVQSRPLEARQELSDLVARGTLGRQDRETARKSLNELGDRIFFTPSRLPEDTFSRQYVVQSGDSLERIARRDDIHVEWGMIQDLNDISNPSMIRLGQRLKIPNGTFHAMVSKSEYTLDLWLENADGRVIIASMPVGLGELNGTPTGNFRIRSNSKLKNPQWKNPRTGEFFLPDDPMNPIGERWIGLQGTDDTNKDLLGIGIHGTIDLDSIGANRSMGCIRMLDPDVKRVFDALTTRGSTVTIVD